MLFHLVAPIDEIYYRVIYMFLFLTFIGQSIFLARLIYISSFSYTDKLTDYFIAFK